MVKFKKKLTSSFCAQVDAGQKPGATEFPIPLRSGDKKGYQKRTKLSPNFSPQRNIRVTPFIPRERSDVKHSIAGSVRFYHGQHQCLR